MKIILRFTLAVALMLVYVAAIADEPNRERQAQLQQILDQNCAVCHGPKLKGKVGPALTAKALTRKDEQTLVTTILEGRSGTVMPSWEFMLKESDARWLVRYLRGGNK